MHTPGVAIDACVAVPRMLPLVTRCTRHRAQDAASYKKPKRTAYDPKFPASRGLSQAPGETVIVGRGFAGNSRGIRGIGGEGVPPAIEHVSIQFARWCRVAQRPEAIARFR